MNRVRVSGTFVIILDEKKFMQFICLVHLAADVQQYSNFHNFRAFHFQNLLPQLKQAVSKADLLLLQIVQQIGKKHAAAKITKTE